MPSTMDERSLGRAASSVLEPPLNGLELVLPLDPARCLRSRAPRTEPLLVQGGLELGAVRMRHVPGAVLAPVASTGSPTTCSS